MSREPPELAGPGGRSHPALPMGHAEPMATLRKREGGAGRGTALTAALRSGCSALRGSAAIVATNRPCTNRCVAPPQPCTTEK
jgi:hypothetical protein